MASLWTYFNHPNFWWVLAGTTFLSAISALVGTFTYLQRKSLMGDAIAHGILPGVAGGFLLAGEKNALVIMIGAIVWGVLTVSFIEWISRKTHLRSSTAMAVVLSAFFGLGMMLLTVVQTSGLPDASGINSFLFGQAASMLPEDLLVYSVFAVVVAFVLAAVYPHLTIISFDRAAAQSSGFNVRRIDAVLSILVVAATAIGIQSIGLILMAALLITPAAIARMWNSRLIGMLVFSGGIAALAAGMGSVVSFTAPSMPTGPWIVLILFAFTLISMVISPQRGLLKRYRQQKKNQDIILRENFIKRLYHQWEKSGQTTFALPEIEDKPSKQTLRFAINNDWIQLAGNTVHLSEKGMREGRRITRAHRLWELYLSKALRMRDDHVHPSAEVMEHLIGDDLEKELLRALDYPQTDPHQRDIPYEP